MDLEPIVISKSEAHIGQSWSITQEDERSLVFSSLPESLKAFPLDLQSRSAHGGIQSDCSLRGASYHGLLFLIDGVRVNDSQTAHHNWDIPLTRADVERIEVIPGAASALYGPDALGGAVQFHLKRIKGDGGQAELSAGSFSSHRELVSVTRGSEGSGVRISAESGQSDGFSEGTDFKTFTSTLYAEGQAPPGAGSVLAAYQEKEFGAYDFYTPGSGFFSQEWTKTYLVSGGLRMQAARCTVRPHLLVRRHEDKFLLDKTLQRSRYLNHHQTDTLLPSLSLEWPLASWLDAGAGVEYGRESLSSTNLGDRLREHHSFSADARLRIGERLHSALSLRTDDYDGIGAVSTGSLGVRYRLREQQEVYAAGSRNIRIPTFTELYYVDPLTAGDPALGAEKAWSYEAGWMYESPSIAASAAVFVRDEEDGIDWVKHSDDQALWRAENINSARVFGVENSARCAIGAGAALRAQYTYIDKRLDDDGLSYKYGLNHTRHQAVLGFELPFGFADAGILCSYKKKPHRDGWLLVDIRISRAIGAGGEVFFSAENLFNEEYQEIEGIPQPGRWITAGVRASW